MLLLQQQCYMHLTGYLIAKALYKSIVQYIKELYVQYKYYRL